MSFNNPQRRLLESDQRIRELQRKAGSGRAPNSQNWDDERLKALLLIRPQLSCMRGGVGNHGLMGRLDTKGLCKQSNGALAPEMNTPNYSRFGMIFPLSDESGVEISMVPRSSSSLGYFMSESLDKFIDSGSISIWDIYCNSISVRSWGSASCGRYYDQQGEAALQYDLE